MVIYAFNTKGFYFSCNYYNSNLVFYRSLFYAFLKIYFLVVKKINIIAIYELKGTSFEVILYREVQSIFNLNGLNKGFYNKQ